MKKHTGGRNKRLRLWEGNRDSLKSRIELYGMEINVRWCNIQNVMVSYVKLSILVPLVQSSLFPDPELLFFWDR